MARKRHKMIKEKRVNVFGKYGGIDAMVDNIAGALKESKNMEQARRMGLMEDLKEETNRQKMETVLGKAGITAESLFPPKAEKRSKALWSE